MAQHPSAPSKLEVVKEKLAGLQEKFKVTKAKIAELIEKKQNELDKELDQDFQVGEKLKQ